MTYTNPIPTVEARRLGLPGHDTYLYSHLLYKDALHRDYGVVRLNMEALKAFSDTMLVSRRESLADHRAIIAKWLQKGGFAAGLEYPEHSDTARAIEYANYENVKIATGFELHLKARLLERDFVLHLIESKPPEFKDLSLQQTRRPILKAELFARSDYHFNGTHNLLPALRAGSIKFSWMVNKPGYSSALELAGDQLDIVRDYRELRNQIHFPGDFLEAPHIRAFGKPMIEFVLSFLNTEIVAGTNRAIERSKLRFAKLSTLK